MAADSFQDYCPSFQLHPCLWNLGLPTLLNSSLLKNKFSNAFYFCIFVFSRAEPTAYRGSYLPLFLKPILPILMTLKNSYELEIILIF